MPAFSKRLQIQTENAMNWDRVQGNWKQFSGKAMEKWGKLTNDEIAQINGNREQLEGKLQAKYGYAVTPRIRQNEKSTNGAVGCSEETPRSSFA